MKLRNILFPSIGILLLTAFITPKVFGQAHPVLFETFGVADDQCPAPNTFYADVNTAVTDKKSKVIHLDYHVSSYNDPMSQFCANGNHVGAILNPYPGGTKAYVFYSAVDRTILSTTSAQTESEFNNANWVPDAENQIDQEYSNNTSPPATMQLVNATLDKSRSNDYVFDASVSVTAGDIGSDSIIIHYAIVEDKVIDHSNYHCSGLQTSFNDVVRFVTYGDSIVFMPGTSSGTVKTVTFHQANVNGSSGGGAPQVTMANTRFIAFIESGGQIVNAAELKDDLDTLKAPPGTLILIDSSVDNHTYTPGDDASIQFSSSNLPSGINVYYSLDNGVTWVFTTTATTSPISWPVPDSLTTQGKIKLASIDFPNLVSIQDANFVIKEEPKITILHPVDTDTLTADSTFLIQWSENEVSSVTLEYAIDNQFSNWQTIATNVTGTSYSWKVPDTNIFAMFKILDQANEAAAAISSDQFLIRKYTVVGPGSVSSSSSQTGLTITSIAPNPANNGEALVVSYADENAPSIKLEMLDLLGHTVVTKTLQSSQSGEADIPTQSLSAGAYIIRMNDGTSTVTKRVEIIR